VEKFYMRL